MSIPEPPRFDTPAPSAWSGAGKRVRHVPGLAAGVIMLVVWVVVTSSGFLPDTGAEQPLADESRLAFPPQILACVVMGLAVAVFGWSGFALAAPAERWLRLMWLPGLYLLGFATFLIGIASPPWPVILSLLFAMFWVAMSEELMFRGILFPALRSALHFWPAVLIGSAVFGAVHLMNAIDHGHLGRATFQSLNAFMLGLLFTALRLRTGSLWPPIALHWLWNVGVFALELSRHGSDLQEFSRNARDAAPLAETSDLPLIVYLVLSACIAPFALYALWLMRRSQRDHMPGDTANDTAGNTGADTAADTGAANPRSGSDQRGPHPE